MNERIRQLLSQAGVHYEVLPKDTVYEKFAELIIQDCLAQVAMIGVSNFEDDDHGDISWTVSKCIEMIKHRFEIKE